MPITIYKSTDVGAPELNGLEGSLIDVLRACLVDGYGFQTSMGWEVAFEDTNRIAFRMPAHTNQAYLYIDDNSPDGNNGRVARHCGYGSMSDINNGLDHFGANISSTNTNIWKSNNNDSSSRKWSLYTNGDFFFFFTEYQISNTNSGFLFGYAPSHISGDNWSTIIANYYHNAVVFVDGVLGRMSYISFLKSSDGGNTNVNVNNYLPFGSSSSGINGPSFSQTNEIRLLKNYIMDAGGGSYNYNVRCILPGLFRISTQFTTSSLTSYDITAPDTITDQDGTIYDLIPGASASGASHANRVIAIQTSGEWEV